MSGLYEKLEHRKTDTYIRPPLVELKVPDFQKMDEIFRQAAKAKAQLQWELDRLPG